MPSAPTIASASPLARGAATSLAIRPLLRAQGMRRLATLSGDLLTLQVEQAPLFVESPRAVEQPIPSLGGGETFYIPTARVARRSRVTQTPHVFLDRRDGGHVLQVQLELVRHPAIDAAATPLPLSNITARLNGPASGTVIDLAVQEIPAGEDEPDIVKKLFCEAPVDAGKVTTILQTDAGAWFEVHGDVHWRQAMTMRPMIPVPDAPAGPAVRPRFSRLRAQAEIGPSIAALAGTESVRLATRLDLKAIRAMEVLEPPARVEPPAGVQSRTIVLAPPDRSGVGASFPPAIAANRPIYAMVTSGFGVDPAQAWIDSPSGAFRESPIPDQFHVLADEYRLAFDVEQDAPAMSVLLVPGAQPADLKLRGRFAIVPWLDPDRIEALRTEIASRTGIPYPQLTIGGVAKATFALSRLYAQLGSDVVGDADDAPLVVDPEGFELVLDCTREFYALLAKMLVSTGLEGEVALSLPAGEGAEPRLTVRPVRLRLDEPAIDVLTTRLEGDGTGAAASLRLVVANPSKLAIDVQRVRPTLLVMDEDMPAPIKAVPATATPAALALAPGAEAAVDLAPSEPQDGIPFGGVAVSLGGVTAALDAAALLARAHELGSAGGMETQVTLRCYQLQHPDVLPATHQDVFGLEVQLRRGEGEPVTVFLTRDAPQATVPVAFSLADIVAGASPEQPRFSWRRRNMAGAGTGEWGEWETIVGRELFVSPVGL